MANVKFGLDFSSTSQSNSEIKNIIKQLKEAQKLSKFDLGLNTKESSKDLENMISILKQQKEVKEKVLTVEKNNLDMMRAQREIIKAQKNDWSESLEFAQDILKYSKQGSLVTKEEWDLLKLINSEEDLKKKSINEQIQLSTKLNKQELAMRTKISEIANKQSYDKSPEQQQLSKYYANLEKSSKAEYEEAVKINKEYDKKAQLLSKAQSEALNMDKKLTDIQREKNLIGLKEIDQEKMKLMYLQQDLQLEMNKSKHKRNNLKIAELELQISKQKQGMAIVETKNIASSEMAFASYLYVAQKIISVAKQQITYFKDLEKSVYDMGVVAEATTEEIKNLRLELLRTASDSSIMAKSMALAIDTILRTGRDLDSAMQIARNGMTLAISSGENLESTVNLINKALTQYRLSADESKEAMERFNSTVLNTPSNLKSLGDGLRQSGSAFANFIELTSRSRNELKNYSVDLLNTNTALLGGMELIGRSGSQGGTSLRYMASQLTVLEKSASKYFDQEISRQNIMVQSFQNSEKQVKLTSNVLSELAQQDLPKTIELISKLYTNGQLSIQTLTKMFGKRQTPYLVSVLSQVNGDMDSFISKITTGKSVSDGFIKNMENWSNQMDKLSNSFQYFSGTLVEPFMDRVGKQYIKTLSKLFQIFGDLSATGDKFAPVLFDLAGGFTSVAITSGSFMTIINRGIPLMKQFFQVATFGFNPIIIGIMALSGAWLGYQQRVRDAQLQQIEYNKNLQNEISETYKKIEALSKITDQYKKDIESLQKTELTADSDKFETALSNIVNDSEELRTILSAIEKIDLTESLGLDVLNSRLKEVFNTFEQGLTDIAKKEFSSQFSKDISKTEKKLQSYFFDLGEGRVFSGMGDMLGLDTEIESRIKRIVSEFGNIKDIQDELIRLSKKRRDDPLEFFKKDKSRFDQLFEVSKQLDTLQKISNTYDKINKKQQDFLASKGLGEMSDKIKKIYSETINVSEVLFGGDVIEKQFSDFSEYLDYLSDKYKGLADIDKKIMSDVMNTLSQQKLTNVEYRNLLLLTEQRTEVEKDYYEQNQRNSQIIQTQIQNLGGALDKLDSKTTTGVFEKIVEDFSNIDEFMTKLVSTEGLEKQFVLINRMIGKIDDSDLVSLIKSGDILELSKNQLIYEKSIEAYTKSINKLKEESNNLEGEAKDRSEKEISNLEHKLRITKERKKSLEDNLLVVNKSTLQIKALRDETNLVLLENMKANAIGAGKFIIDQKIIEAKIQQLEYDKIGIENLRESTKELSGYETILKGINNEKTLSFDIDTANKDQIKDQIQVFEAMKAQGIKFTNEQIEIYNSLINLLQEIINLENKRGELDVSKSESIRKFIKDNEDLIKNIDKQDSKFSKILDKEKTLSELRDDYGNKDEDYWKNKIKNSLSTLKNQKNELKNLNDSLKGKDKITEEDSKQVSNIEENIKLTEDKLKKDEQNLTNQQRYNKLLIEQNNEMLKTVNLAGQLFDKITGTNISSTLGSITSLFEMDTTTGLNTFQQFGSMFGAGGTGLSVAGLSAGLGIAGAGFEIVDAIGGIYDKRDKKAEQRFNKQLEVLKKQLDTFESLRDALVGYTKDTINELSSLPTKINAEIAGKQGELILNTVLENTPDFTATFLEWDSGWKNTKDTFEVNILDILSGIEQLTDGGENVSKIFGENMFKDFIGWGGDATDIMSQLDYILQLTIDDLDDMYKDFASNESESALLALQETAKAYKEVINSLGLLTSEEALRQATLGGYELISFKSKEDYRKEIEDMLSPIKESSNMAEDEYNKLVDTIVSGYNEISSKAGLIIRNGLKDSQSGIASFNELFKTMTTDINSHLADIQFGQTFENVNNIIESVYAMLGSSSEALVNSTLLTTELNWAVSELTNEMENLMNFNPINLLSMSAKELIARGYEIDKVISETGVSLKDMGYTTEEINKLWEDGEISWETVNSEISDYLKYQESVRHSSMTELEILQEAVDLAQKRVDLNGEDWEAKQDLFEAQQALNDQLEENISATKDAFLEMFSASTYQEGVDSFANYLYDTIIGKRNEALSSQYGAEISALQSQADMVQTAQDFARLQAQISSLSAQAESERLQREAISSILNPTQNVEYQSESSDITYQTGSTQNVVYNNYNTVRVEFVNSIGFVEEAGTEIGQAIVPYIEQALEGRNG